MSIILPLSDLSKIQLAEIRKDFTCKTLPTAYCLESIVYRCYLKDEANDALYIPMRYAKKYFNEKDGFPNGEASDFPSMNKKVQCKVVPLTKKTDPKKRNRDQDAVLSKALSDLKNHSTVFLGLYTGFGKTACAIYLSIQLGLKTVVLCHLDSVRDQWPGEWNTFSGGTIKVQVVKGSKCVLDPTADVYIIGVIKASLMSSDDFVNIGTVVVDEAHIASGAIYTKTLLKFHPRYLIGLSATFDKGCVHLMEKYFGSPADFIIRKEIKDFKVIKVQTPFRPEVSYTTVYGKTVPDWNAITNSLEENPDRWNYIVDNIITRHPSEKMIILCNRNALVNGICDILESCDEPHAKYIGGTKSWDKSKRILVAGMKKGGVGLNDPDLTVAIIASGTQDVRQYEGRLRTVDCTVYHLVDNYSTCEKHWEPCKEWYLEKGATLEIMGEARTQKKKGSVPIKKYVINNNPKV